MKRNSRGMRASTWTWCTALVALSALVGTWNATDPAAEPVARQSHEAQHDGDQIDLHKMESTLAQAGCPGWMVLASEGQAATVELAGARA